MRSATQLRREEAFDGWLDRQFGSGLDSPAAGEAAVGWDDEVASMTEVATLVKTHVTHSLPILITSPSTEGYFRGATIARIAAVVLLVVGLGVSIALAATRSPTGNLLPAVTTGSMPSGLYDDLVSEAGTSGNPYPKTPVYWVKTTAALINAYLSGNHVPAQAGVRTPEWVGQVTSRFYGDPEHESSVYSTILDVWAPGVGTPRNRHAGAQVSGFSPVARQVLQDLGTVHSQFLRPPSPAPTLPARLETVVAQDMLRRNGNRATSSPALWVKTSVGTLGAATDHALGLSARPTGLTVWVVVVPPELDGSSSRMPEADWYAMPRTSDTGAQPVIWHYFGLHLPAKDQRIGDLSILGSLHNLWLSAPPPRTLAPGVQQTLAKVLPTMYKPWLSSLHVNWVATTAARLRSQLPWTEIASDVPGPTTIWIVQVTDAKAIGGYSDQWFTEWSNNPASSSYDNSETSLGGSGLFGITRLSQLGTVHTTNVSSFLG